MPEVQKYIRVGDTLTNILDSNTKEDAQFTKVTTFGNGTPMSDLLCDPAIYKKLGSEYFERAHSAVEIEWFGAVGDAEFDEGTQTYVGTDNTAAFQAARDWAAKMQYAHPKNVQPIEIRFKGKYLITASPNWAIEKLRMTTVGKAEIICTGSGAVLDLDNTAGTRPKFNMYIGSFMLTGNATTDVICNIRYISHSVFDNITVRNANPTTGKGFFMEAMVCNCFLSPTLSLNQTPLWLSAPKWGMYLAKHATKGASTANTFINAIIEFAAIGIELEAQGSDFNHWQGGTSEGCSDTGIVIQANNRGNVFEDFGLEANALFDVVDKGIGTSILGGYSSGTIKFQGARLAKLSIPLAQRIEIDATSSGVNIFNCQVNRSLSAPVVGGIFPANRSTVVEMIYDLGNTTWLKTGKSGTTEYLTLNTATTYDITPTHDIQVFEVTPSAATTINIAETTWNNLGCILKFKSNGNFPISIKGVTGVTINGLTTTAVTLNRTGDYVEIALSGTLNAWRIIDKNLKATTTEVVVGTDPDKFVTPEGSLKAFQSWAPFIVQNRTTAFTLNPSFRGVSVLTNAASEITHILSTDVVGEGLVGQVIEFNNTGAFPLHVAIDTGVTVDGGTTTIDLAATTGYIRLIRTAANTWKKVFKI